MTAAPCVITQKSAVFHLLCGGILKSQINKTWVLKNAINFLNIGGTISPAKRTLAYAVA
jgi:hypothetical protein